MTFETNKIRPSRVAGSFYEGNPEALKRELAQRLAAAPSYSGGGQIVAAAVPHAGYVFSADIAAAVFKALANAVFDTVVIIGHDFGSQAPGIIGVLPDYEAFRTPLGDVHVDRELCDALLAADQRFVTHNGVHRQEHTVEVQLPFLQMIKDNFSIVPIMFGEVTAAHCRRLAELLQKLQGDRRILVLSSTDLSHYPASSTARKLDAKTVSFAEAMDIDGLCRWKNSGEWEAERGVETPICSAGGLGTAIAWAGLNGAKAVTVMRRGNSGDVSGDEERVVGYASLLFVTDETAEIKPVAAKTANDRPSENGFALSKATQSMLLNLARRSIEERAAGRTYDPELPDDNELLRPAAVFVTLHKHGQLRGCIGTTVAHQPLVTAVSDYACMAAFEDPRFRPVTSDELADIDIEISVLSPMRRIHDVSEIVPKLHGVTVRQGRRSGLFLPQVWDQLPDMESFMGYLCAEKAGLPYDAWKSPQTEISVFTVHAFQEGQP